MLASFWVYFKTTEFLLPKDKILPLRCKILSGAKSLFIIQTEFFRGHRHRLSVDMSRRLSCGTGPVQRPGAPFSLIAEFAVGPDPYKLIANAFLP
jgi:hypothetical protein